MALVYTRATTNTVLIAVNTETATTISGPLSSWLILCVLHNR